MSTAAAAPRLVTAPPVRSLVPVLARQEARRLMLHPITLIGFALYLIILLESGVLSEDGPRAAFETTTTLLTFFPGVLLILSANLVATRDRRADADELLAPLPGRAEERFKALALAALAPAGAALVPALALHASYLADDRYVVAPTVWHLLAGPVTLVGACLFGILLGLWVPARGAAVVGLVAMVVANAWLDNQSSGQLLGLATTWAAWGPTADQWAGLVPGSAAWHLGYLVSLCALAVAAAWVRVADRRTPPVVLGLVALTAAVLTGTMQWP
ncbi:MAG TPA: hypothetical protein PLP61_02505 [Nocardioides sp.]|uniref:hypothetical protein n=1 Tax=Nocardioides sp. TaxID=35761 RepID=UPI002B672AD1|nr:hypothetical protein [Nocardioides sp.]HQR25887.1 hypothetical protein [Nocardioides sp.]